MALCIRSVSGLSGSVLLWSGMYSTVVNRALVSPLTACAVPNTCALDLIVNATVLGIGFFVVFVTGTWSSACYITSPMVSSEGSKLQRLLQMHSAADEVNMTLTDHIRYTVRAIASIFGQVRH